MRKPAKTKGQSSRTADQRFRFCYIDSTIPLLLNPKFQAYNCLLWLYCTVCVGPGRIPEDRVPCDVAQLISISHYIIFKTNQISLFFLQYDQLHSNKKIALG